MKKVKTEAAKAEAELNQLFGEEFRLNKNYLLEDRHIEPILIDGIVDDILLLLFEPNFLRPSFKVEKERAEIPSIFCKMIGDIDLIIADCNYYKNKNNSAIHINNGYRGIAKTPHRHVFRRRPQWFTKDGGIDVSRALKEDLGPLNILSPNYRRNYLEAINRVLDLFKNNDYALATLTQREILETLMYNSNKIIKMFHKYDYQKHAPKFIIDERGRTTITQFAFVRLLLMQNLGFDVVFLSESGFASIENYLATEDCRVYYLTPKEQRYSATYMRKMQRRKNLIRLGLAIVALLILLILFRFL